MIIINYNIKAQRNKKMAKVIPKMEKSSFRITYNTDKIKI